MYYEKEGKILELNSHLVVKGDNSLYTAMAKTVGLPLGIATKMILNNTITTKGVALPISKEIYVPALKELENHGITFIEDQKEIQKVILHLKLLFL